MCDATPGRQWQQVRHYTDHLGYPVVLEQRVELDWEPEAVFMVPIQVYSLFPLEENHETLRDYLLGSFDENSENVPLFEFYSYIPPNMYACINHNRREIAHRKQQHRVGVPNPPPLIPQFLELYHEHPMGCCILLTSQSYRLGYVQDSDKYIEVGEGPSVLWFTCSFSSTRAEPDELQRKSSAMYPAYGEIHPEALELSIELSGNQEFVPETVYNYMFERASEMGLESRSLEYAMDVDEGEHPFSPPLQEDEIRLHLHKQGTARGYKLGDAFQVSRDGTILTVTNTQDGTQPDIQYAVYASFLSHLTENTASDLIEPTARLFTAAIASHLPTSQSITLKFCTPDSNSWGAILPAHTKAFGAHGCDLPTGAVRTFSRDPSENEPVMEYRVSPQMRRDSIDTARAQLRDPYRVFAVVLDRPNFLDEAGVYFFMADIDKSSRGQYDEGGTDLEVWRCTSDMALIARRLAMLVVEEDDGTVQ